MIKHASIICALVLAVASGSAHGQIIYSETFDNSTGNDQVVSTVGWTAYLANGSTPAVGDLGISRFNGNPNPPAGYLFNGQGTAWVAFDTFSAITPNTTPITWKMGNSSTALTIRLAVQSGGNWYATDTTFSNTVAFGSATAFASPNASQLLTIDQSFVYTTAAASWRTLTITPSTSVVLGGVASSDLESTITGIGYYGAGGGVVRLDTLTVVPEPTTGMLLLGSGIVLLLLRRRIRKE